MTVEELRDALTEEVNAGRGKSKCLAMSTGSVEAVTAGYGAHADWMVLETTGNWEMDD